MRGIRQFLLVLLCLTSTFSNARADVKIEAYVCDLKGQASIPPYRFFFVGEDDPAKSPVCTLKGRGPQGDDTTMNNMTAEYCWKFMAELLMNNFVCKKNEDTPAKK